MLATSTRPTNRAKPRDANRRLETTRTIATVTTIVAIPRSSLNTGVFHPNRSGITWISVHRKFV